MGFVSFDVLKYILLNYISKRLAQSQYIPRSSFILPSARATVLCELFRLEALFVLLFWSGCFVSLLLYVYCIYVYSAGVCL